MTTYQKIKLSLDSWLSPEDLLWARIVGEVNFANGITNLVDGYDKALRQRLASPLNGDLRKYVQGFAASHGFIIYDNRYKNNAEMAKIYEKSFKTVYKKLTKEQEEFANQLLQEQIEKMPESLKKEVKSIIKNEKQNKAKKPVKPQTSKPVKPQVDKTTNPSNNEKKQNG
jgi:hypothetical protein